MIDRPLAFTSATVPKVKVAGLIARLAEFENFAGLSHVALAMSYVLVLSHSVSLFPFSCNTTQEARYGKAT